MEKTATQPCGARGLHDGSTTGNPRQSSGTRHRPDPFSQASALEQLPHLARQITAIWGERECETYVNRLIMDSRDGKRQGLPLEAAQELLFLVELSIARRALVASQVTGVPFAEMYAQCLAAASTAAGAADPWSDPGAHREAGHVGRDRPRTRAASASASRQETEKKSWWRRLVA